jgi:enhancer of mRNA-decapping protein 4
LFTFQIRKVIRKSLNILTIRFIHRDHNPDEQFWKFAVTGSNQNSELKLWSCENWTCLQTVQFQSSDEIKNVALKAALDLSAQFLLLSDIYRKNVFVLQMQQDSQDKMKFVSVSEFATPSPFLSMAMLEAGVKKVSDKHTMGEDDSDEEEDEPVEDPQGLYFDTKCVLRKLSSIEHSQYLDG